MNACNLECNSSSIAKTVHDRSTDLDWDLVVLTLCVHLVLALLLLAVTTKLVVLTVIATTSSDLAICLSHETELIGSTCQEPSQPITSR